MIDYEANFGRPSYALESKAALAATFRIVYGWMTAGLTLSGLVAWYTATSGLWKHVLQGPGFIGCVVVELLTVVLLSIAINKLPVWICYLMFLGYALLNGLTLSVVFIAFEMAVVEKVFFITAGMFGGVALWGTFTKSDLSSIGWICGMLLWGLIVAGVVNMFACSPGLDYVCSFAGIIVFTGLTMYDAQKIKQIAASEGKMGLSELRKVGIMGALQLYLDFVNLFLHILRFFGRKR